MIRRSLYLFLAVCACCLLGLPLSAQTDLPLHPDYTMYRPPNWIVTDYDYGFVLDGINYSIYVIDPVELSEALRLTWAESPISILRRAYSWSYTDGTPYVDEIETLDIDGRSAYAYHYVHAADNYEGLFLLLAMSDGTYGLLDIYTYTAYYRDPADTLAPLIVSFDSVNVVEETESALCRVITDQAQTATLRVGPGEGRTPIAFLPAGVEVLVIALSVQNGVEWFQLDKVQAAPQSDALDVWMRRGDADELGDCDSVRVSGANVTVVTPNPIRVITPLPGTWILSIEPTYTRSCQGVEWVEEIPASDVFSLMSYEVTVGIATVGILIDDVLYPRTPGTNHFEHTAVIEDGYSFQEFNFTSTTAASGFIVGNRAIDGLLCRGASAFTFTRLE